MKHEPKQNKPSIIVDHIAGIGRFQKGVAVTLTMEDGGLSMRIRFMRPPFDVVVPYSELDYEYIPKERGVTKRDQLKLRASIPEPSDILLQQSLGGGDISTFVDQLRQAGARTITEVDEENKAREAYELETRKAEREKQKADLLNGSAGKVMTLEKPLPPLPKGAYITVYIKEDGVLFTGDGINITLPYAKIMCAVQDYDYKDDFGTYYRIEYIPDLAKPTTTKTIMLESGGVPLEFMYEIERRAKAARTEVMSIEL
jgi:hypothetical protein